MENFTAETTFEEYLGMLGIANFDELPEEEQAKLVQDYQDALANLVKMYEEENKKNKTQISVMKNQMELGLLKIKSDLSGKKWDAAMKGLAKHGLVKVSLVGESKIVEMVG